MFHVAICDDEKTVCAGIEICLAEYSGADQIEITLFEDGKALCCAMRRALPLIWYFLILK